jgi:hypothetical protein
MEDNHEPKGLMLGAHVVFDQRAGGRVLLDTFG